MLSQVEIDARLARYAVTVHGSDLWPEVTVLAFRAAHREVLRVTTAALCGTEALVALQLPPGVDPHALGVVAFAGGIGPLLGYWIEAGRVAAEPEAASLMAVQLDHGRRRAAKLRAELVRILEAFRERGIEALLLKGMHTAGRFFPDPGTRPLADVDLLVAPRDAGGASEALRRLGFAMPGGGGDAGRDHWQPPGVGPVRSLDFAHADDPWSLDLHFTLDRTPFRGLTMSLGRVEPSDGEVWDGLGHPVRVLRQPLLLAFLALHAGVHLYSMPLSRLVELVLVARAGLGGTAERWREFDELVRRTRSARFVFPALHLAERLVPGTFDPGTLAALAAGTPPGFRRRIRALEPWTAQRLHPQPNGNRFVWAATPRERLAAAVEIAWPSARGRRYTPAELVAHHWRLARAVLRRFTSLSLA